MTIRALIVAVEDYPESTTTSRKLPGTIKSGERFNRWLTEHLRVEQRNVVFCASGNSAFKTHGTTISQIRKAILALIRQGHNDTDQLYVFLCGHGVMIPGREYDLDVLLCSDFIDPAISGNACLEVNELTELLACSLGIGTHLYFVDACRTQTENLDAVRLGITPFDATSGKADWFQLSSGRPEETVPTNSLFMETLLESMAGNCELIADATDEGKSWITFQNVAQAVARTFADHARQIFVRSEGNADFRIQSVARAVETPTIVDELGIKLPPVALLVEFDEIIFLGETNGQLPKFVKKAFEIRQRRNKGRWNRLEILSIENLNTAFRNEASLPLLQQERSEMEAFFKNEAAKIADDLTMYRYRYIGTYGSLWKNSTGKRRVHVSAGLTGEDIRVSPASDYVDFQGSRHPKVDRYFELVRRTIDNDESCRCIFRHVNEG